MKTRKKTILASLGALTAILIAGQMARAANTETAPVSSTVGDPGCEESETLTWNPPPSMEFVLDVDGEPYDLINLYIHGSVDQFKSALKSADWVVGPEADFSHNMIFVSALAFTGLEFPVEGAWLGIEEISKEIFRHPRHLKKIPNPVKSVLESQPISVEHHCRKKAQLMYEMRKHSVSRRDHIRIYDLGQTDKDGQPVYGIAASKDIGIKFDIHRVKFFFMNHMIEENEDHERDFLVESLDHAGAVDHVEHLSLQNPPPLSGSGAYSADAFADDLYLTPSAP